MRKPEDDARKALLERAQALLSTDASPVAKKNIKSNLESLAATLLLEWLVGDKRFESQSQQTEYWLSRFYDSVFVDEQPDATRIYERFGVNLPRAGYLARLLRARRAAQWRQAARAELKTQLERYKDRAEEAGPCGGTISARLNFRIVCALKLPKGTQSARRPQRSAQCWGRFVSAVGYEALRDKAGSDGYKNHK
jgi:hypothetical protein